MPKSVRRSTRHASQPCPCVESLKTSVRTRSRQQPTQEASAKLSGKSRTTKQLALALLARSQHEVEADPNRTIRLFSIPKELLQQIACELPLASVMCLTLACKEAAEFIGTQSWMPYKKEKQWSMVRKSFCELLARDWGDILGYCPCCNTLHPPLQPARSHRGTKLTKGCFGQDAMIDYLPWDDSRGYHPFFTHIADALTASEQFASKRAFGPVIEMLSGDFTIAKNSILWRLKSMGQRIDGNLIIKHVHTFKSKTNTTLCATDLLSLPIRLCPHQLTTTDSPERSRYIKSAELNAPLFTHVITSAFPKAVQAVVNLRLFKQPTPSEQEQISRAQAGKIGYWRCRSCPTKYLVQHSKDTFEILSWHSLGRDLYHASKYWKWLVRREGTLLGPEKRNDE